MRRKYLRYAKDTIAFMMNVRILKRKENGFY